MLTDGMSRSISGLQAVQLDKDSFGAIVSARITVHPAALKVCTGGSGHGARRDAGAGGAR